jgi:8-amino-7-oxononanoate synthase
MRRAEEKIDSFIKARKEAHSFRQLFALDLSVDFCSNDYLGLARSERLGTSALNILNETSRSMNGATGSRLLSGNRAFTEALEYSIAAFHEAEAALIFNSGYDANLGLLSSILSADTSVCYDELCHASIIDGIRLSRTDAFKFRHNDPEDLRKKLAASSGIRFVVVESVYSMDGDISPLELITEICNEYGAALIVDEAHAGGVFGNKGEGRICEAGLAGKVFARVFTYGKAFGCHGAAVAGSHRLKDYLINTARSLIYSTALPPHSLALIDAAYKLMPELDEERNRLQANISYFNGLIASMELNGFLKSETPIQSIIIEGNREVRAFAASLQKMGFDIRPVLSPTVPKGKERVRICLHSYNSEQEIESLCLSVMKYQQQNFHS